MYDKLKNDKKAIKNALSVVGEMTVATKPIKVVIPEYYIGKKLASFGSEIFIVGVFAYIVDDKYYAVSRCPAMIKTEPSRYHTVKHDSVVYYELVYEAGDAVIANNNMVQDPSIASSLFSVFIDQGKNPWFFKSDDLNIDHRTNVFINCDKYAGMKVGAGPAPISMIISTTSRSPIDDTKPYRLYLNENKSNPQPPVLIGLKNIEFIASSTISRLSGSYYNDALGSALINPSTKIEGLEPAFRE